MQALFLFTLLSLVSSFLQFPIKHQVVLGIQKQKTAQEEFAGPFKDPNQIGVELDAEAGVSLDVETGKVLFAKNSEEPLAMASLTKLMTALVILSSPKYNPQDQVKISRQAALLRKQGSDIKLRAGEIVSAKDLLKGILIASGNDASLAMAEYIGGNEENFVNLMNEEAKKLGLKNTHFMNSHGLDTPGHYSTAYDLAFIARELVKFPEFLEIIRTKKYEFQSIAPGYRHFFKNTNKLLDNSFLKILGGKTGFTDEAHFCLMLVGEKQGHKIINVVLGSRDAFQDSKNLMDWIISVYSW